MGQVNIINVQPLYCTGGSSPRGSAPHALDHNSYIEAAAGGGDGYLPTFKDTPAALEDGISSHLSSTGDASLLKREKAEHINSILAVPDTQQIKETNKGINLRAEEEHPLQISLLNNLPQQHVGSVDTSAIPFDIGPNGKNTTDVGSSTQKQYTA